MSPTMMLRRGFRSSAIIHSRAEVQAKLARIELERPFSPSLVDSFSRRHDYLRISLTERCNLRCFYCMPSEGVELSPHGKILTDDEVLRLAGLFVRSGVKKIRLTGGEPTLRKNLLDIIAGLNELRPYGLKSIGMTTNGIALHRKLPQFVENGLTHLNLSLDTLDPLKFETITRRKGQEAVLRSLDVALSYPLEAVKINVVVMKGLNDSEVLDFIALTKDRPISVRFIEFMPFTGNEWEKNKMVMSSDLLATISSAYRDVERAADELNDTARNYRVRGFAGSFGFISSMSDHFCASCNRLRITADGNIKVCLFDAKEMSLRDAMRRGASNAELMEIIGKAVYGKQEKHVGMEDIDVVSNRSMIKIGGYSNLSRPFKRRWDLPASLVHHSWQRPSHVPLPHIRCMSSNSKLSHLDGTGRSQMVDVSTKVDTTRVATASGRIYIPQSAYDIVTSTYPVDEDKKLTQAKEKARRKGDVLTVSQLAAIMAAKKTSDLIPLCHPLLLSNIFVKLTPETPSEDSCGRHAILCVATVSCRGQTGVEMEALTAVTVGLLTVWDMMKAVAGKEMEIGNVMVTQKSGGKSDFSREKQLESTDRAQ